jgi:uncharacterized protein (UPF0332 family)
MSYNRFMQERVSAFLEKAEESLAGAASEFVNGRYNNCANRCYYACFQAAISALAAAGIQPPGRDGQWGHDSVQAQFNGQLVNRRKLYPTSVRPTLEQTYRLRAAADYKRDPVSAVQGGRALRRAEEFLDVVRRKGQL